MKTRVFFEYAYLAIFIFSVAQVIQYWNHPETKHRYIYIAFAVGALLMFFLRRSLRKRGER